MRCWRDRSCTAATKFLALENDEVLVEGLEGGVGEARGAVEDGPAKEDHVKPLEQGTAGKAVEDGFLVEAAGVEVGVAECGEEGRVLQALVAGDKLGLHGGVLVVFGDPVSDAFREGIVVERIAEVGDDAFDLEDLVDGSCIAGTLGTYETDVKGRDLGVLEPGIEEVVAAAYAECGCFWRGGEGELLHLAGEFGSWPLVGVEEEDPRVLEGDGGEGGVAVRRVVVEGRV